MRSVARLLWLELRIFCPQTSFHGPDSLLILQARARLAHTSQRTKAGSSKQWSKVCFWIRKSRRPVLSTFARSVTRQKPREIFRLQPNPGEQARHSGLCFIACQISDLQGFLQCCDEFGPRCADSISGYRSGRSDFLFRFVWAVNQAHAEALYNRSEGVSQDFVARLFIQFQDRVSCAVSMSFRATFLPSCRPGLPFPRPFSEP